MTTHTPRPSTYAKGFTVVELITAIAVIAILTGLSIAGYSQWRKTVAQREVQSDLIGAATAMESARNFGSGYPLAIPSSFVKSAGVNLTYKTGGTATAFCLDGSSVKVPSVTYYLSSTNGNKTPAVGTCP